MAAHFQYSFATHADGIATTAGALLTAEDSRRSYLFVRNRSATTWLILGVGAVPEGNAGVAIPPLGVYEMVEGENLTARALYLKSEADGGSVPWSALIGLD